MTMGFFDLPSPLFRWIDALMTPLPLAGRLVVWALVASALSMWLYKVLSPQKKLVATEQAALAARQRLNAYDGEFDGAWPLIAGVFRTAGRRLWLALPPALVASVPIIALIVWISNDYGYRFPADGEPVATQTRPAEFDAAFVQREGAVPHVAIRPAGENALSEVPMPAPSPVIEKHRWWNVLIANPAGYLPDAGPVERIEVALPSHEVVPFGPSWVRGWEVLFFSLFLVFSLVIKRVGKIA